MRLPLKIHLRRSAALLLVWIMLLACNLLLPPGPTTTPAVAPNQPAGAATVASGQSTPFVEAASVESDPLDRLLTMRSIKFNLTALDWDGASRSIDVEIDSAGNMHVKGSRPGLDPALLPKGFDPKSLPGGYELYVVDGKAYQADDQNPGWMTTPLYENYIQLLSQKLHGPDGPALWLDLLPLGRIHSAGKDTVGGFAVDKYTVNGQVDGQSITGAIWFEPQADALVQAELHVPAILLCGPEDPQKGELKITLNAQKADVPPVTLPAAPAGQPGATTTPAPGSASTGSGTLAIRDSYPMDVANSVIGFSLAASPGKVWVGTGKGTIEQVDSQSGAFVQSIPLDASGSSGSFVTTLGFDGQYIAALEQLSDQKGARHPHVFAIDSGSGKVVHQWDLESSDWSKEPSLFAPDDLGVSPGKIWVDGHVIDTQTFEVKKGITMPGMTRFAYNGNGWMWITGDTGGSCDDLIFIKTDDPDKVVCESRLPFMIEPNDVYPDVSRMTLAGDRMWMVSSGGAGQNLTLAAYPADMDQLMKATKPLVIVPLMDSSHSVRILFAGNFLWVLWTSGDKRGFLYQLDPQTGATINSLDLIGDQRGNGISDPQDIATEGDNLWILTIGQLLRIKLP